MTTAYLGIGSNVDAEHNVPSALGELEKVFPMLRLSPIYRSKAVGFEGEDFINLVAAVETELSPRALRDFLRDLEDRHGRLRDVPKFSDRSLDIDILLYGNVVMDTPELKLPRPEILRFAHVLKPLADLAPILIYPGGTQPFSVLWTQSGLDHSCLKEITLKTDS